MKSRFLAVLFAFILFLPLNAEAKISRQYDSFNGHQAITSVVTSKIGDLSRIVLSKGYSKGSVSPNYMLTLSKHSHDQWWFFSHDCLEIKIDGKIEKLSVYKSDSEYIKENGYLPLYNYTHIILPDQIIDKLKAAETVVMRVYFENRGSIDIQLNSKVLAEWKQVIAAEK